MYLIWKYLMYLSTFFKKWVLDQDLYLVYIWGTWCTWVLGQLYMTPTLFSTASNYPSKLSKYNISSLKIFLSSKRSTLIITRCFVVLFSLTKSLLLHSPIIIHDTWISWPYATHILLILSSYSAHIQLIFSSYSAHIQLIFSSYSAHIQLIFSSYSAHI